MLFRELYLNFSKDNRCQGSVELILIVGGIIVIILLVVALYKSYIIELGDEINSGEVSLDMKQSEGKLKLITRKVDTLEKARTILRKLE